jgi:predicted phage gp36 major capsid-like protein
MKNVSTTRIGEVDSDAAFIAVAGEVVRGRAGGVEGRAPSAGVVANTGFLDFEDVRAEISQELATIGPSQDTGSVEDTKTSQRRWGFG